MLDSRGEGTGQNLAYSDNSSGAYNQSGADNYSSRDHGQAPTNDLDDEIPF